MSADPRALGFDFARTDGIVDFDIVAQRALFVGIRATISWGYQDSWFPRNWSESKRVGLHRFAYHVLYPGEDAKRQADNFLSVVKDWDRAWPVVDAELDHGQSKQRITDCLLACATIIRIATGKDPLIYSRKSWIDEFTEPGAWRGNRVWWLAQFMYDRSVEHPGPPPLPEGVTSWLIQQTADKFPPPAGQQQSVEADTDRWNGDAQAVEAFFSGAVQPPPPPALPTYVTTRGGYVNLHSTHDIIPANVTGVIRSQRLAVIGDAGDTWHVSGDWYVAKSVTEPVE